MSNSSIRKLSRVNYTDTAQTPFVQRKMRLIIREDTHEAADFIAEYIIGKINNFAATAENPFVLGLPTGSSPIPIYKSLILAHQSGHVSFRHVVTFNMDEYVGIPRDHPESYHTFMFKNLFSLIDIESV